MILPQNEKKSETVFSFALGEILFTCTAKTGIASYKKEIKKKGRKYFKNRCHINKFNKNVLE